MTQDLRAASAARYVPAEVTYRLDSIAALLGARRTWESPADLLEVIAYEINEARDPSAAPKINADDPTALAYWRAVADDLGIDYPEDDE